MATIKVCDVCGKASETTDLFAVDRTMDAAGSMSDDLVRLDLCWKHRSMAMERSFRFLARRSDLEDYEISRIVVESVHCMQGKGKD
jgi:hypothetical protein